VTDGEAGRSSGSSVTTRSRVGSATALIRSACRLVASSNTLRTQRPLPNVAGRGLGSSRRYAASRPGASVKPAWSAYSRRIAHSSSSP
jgi:hypothetical protein